MSNRLYVILHGLVSLVSKPSGKGLSTDEAVKLLDNSKQENRVFLFADQESSDQK